jgi:hypothetical protein
MKTGACALCQCVSSKVTLRYFHFLVLASVLSPHPSPISQGQKSQPMEYHKVYLSSFNPSNFIKTSGLYQSPDHALIVQNILSLLFLLCIFLWGVNKCSPLHCDLQCFTSHKSNKIPRYVGIDTYINRIGTQNFTMDFCFLFDKYVCMFVFL